jgi:hypothetical protein
VILDISACTAANNTITGNSYGSGNNFNALSSDIKGIMLPSTLASIGNYAFYYCSGLTSVTIPASVTSIGASAFAYCTVLTSVTFAEGSNITTQWNHNSFPGSPSESSTNVSLWTAYNTDSKAGTYIFTDNTNWIKQ